MPKWKENYLYRRIMELFLGCFREILSGLLLMQQLYIGLINYEREL